MGELAAVDVVLLTRELGKTIRARQINTWQHLLNVYWSETGKRLIELCYGSNHCLDIRSSHRIHPQGISIYQFSPASASQS